jgi:hypothetical protein
MYEYLSAGTVRRTFTDSNLSLINTDADRFMKAAWVLPRAQGETAGQYNTPTVLDNNLAGLAAVLREWNPAVASYSQPAANLSEASAGGVVSSASYAAGYYLNVGTSKANALQASHDLDWLLASYAQDRSNARATNLLDSVQA